MPFLFYFLALSLITAFAVLRPFDTSRDGSPTMVETMDDRHGEAAALLLSVHFDAAQQYIETMRAAGTPVSPGSITSYTVPAWASASTTPIQVWLAADGVVYAWYSGNLPRGISESNLLRGLRAVSGGYGVVSSGEVVYQFNETLDGTYASNVGRSAAPASVPNGTVVRFGG